MQCIFDHYVQSFEFPEEFHQDGVVEQFQAMYSALKRTGCDDSLLEGFVKLIIAANWLSAERVHAVLECLSDEIVLMKILTDSHHRGAPASDISVSKLLFAGRYRLPPMELYSLYDYECALDVYHRVTSMVNISAADDSSTFVTSDMRSLHMRLQAKFATAAKIAHSVLNSKVCISPTAEESCPDVEVAWNDEYFSHIQSHYLPGLKKMLLNGAKANCKKRKHSCNEVVSFSMLRYACRRVSTGSRFMSSGCSSTDAMCLVECISMFRTVTDADLFFRMVRSTVVDLVDMISSVASNCYVSLDQDITGNHLDQGTCICNEESPVARSTNTIMRCSIIVMKLYEESLEIAMPSRDRFKELINILSWVMGIVSVSTLSTAPYCPVLLQRLQSTLWSCVYQTSSAIDHQAEPIILDLVDSFYRQAVHTSGEEECVNLFLFCSKEAHLRMLIAPDSTELVLVERIISCCTYPSQLFSTFVLYSALRTALKTDSFDLFLFVLKIMMGTTSVVCTLSLVGIVCLSMRCWLSCRNHSDISGLKPALLTTRDRNFIAAVVDLLLRSGVNVTQLLDVSLNDALQFSRSKYYDVRTSLLPSIVDCVNDTGGQLLSACFLLTILSERGAKDAPCGNEKLQLVCEWGVNRCMDPGGRGNEVLKVISIAAGIISSCRCTGFVTSSMIRNIDILLSRISRLMYEDPMLNCLSMCCHVVSRTVAQVKQTSDSARGLSCTLDENFYATVNSIVIDILNNCSLSVHDSSVLMSAIYTRTKDEMTRNHILNCLSILDSELGTVATGLVFREETFALITRDLRDISATGLLTLIPLEKYINSSTENFTLPPGKCVYATAGTIQVLLDGYTSYITVCDSHMIYPDLASRTICCVHALCSRSSITHDHAGCVTSISVDKSCLNAVRRARYGIILPVIQVSMTGLLENLYCSLGSLSADNADLLLRYLCVCVDILECIGHEGVISVLSDIFSQRNIVVGILTFMIWAPAEFHHMSYFFFRLVKLLHISYSTRINSQTANVLFVLFFFVYFSLEVACCPQWIELEFQSQLPIWESLLCNFVDTYNDKDVADESRSFILPRNKAYTSLFVGKWDPIKCRHKFHTWNVHREPSGVFNVQLQPLFSENNKIEWKFQTISDMSMLLLILPCDMFVDVLWKKDWRYETENSTSEISNYERHTYVPVISLKRNKVQQSVELAMHLFCEHCEMHCALQYSGNMFRMLHAVLSLFLDNILRERPSASPLSKYAMDNTFTFRVYCDRIVICHHAVSKFSSLYSATECQPIAYLMVIDSVANFLRKVDPVLISANLITLVVNYMDCAISCVDSLFKSCTTVTVSQPLGSYNYYRQGVLFFTIANRYWTFEYTPKIEISVRHSVMLFKCLTCLLHISYYIDLKDSYIHNTCNGCIDRNLLPKSDYFTLLSILRNLINLNRCNSTMRLLVRVYHNSVRPHFESSDEICLDVEKLCSGDEGGISKNQFDISRDCLDEPVQQPCSSTVQEKSERSEVHMNFEFYTQFDGDFIEDVPTDVPSGVDGNTPDRSDNVVTTHEKWNALDGEVSFTDKFKLNF